MKRVIYILLIIASTLSLNAQNNKQTKLLKRANKELSDLRYAYAIPLFKAYLLKMPKDANALKSLSLTYKKLNQYDSALLYMKLAITNGAKLDNNVPELYATVGNYNSAKLSYQELMGTNKSKLSEARLFGFTNTKKTVADSLDFTIFNTKINTGYNEFNATLFNGGIVFESNRIKLKNKSKRALREAEFAWDGAGYSNLYIYPSIEDIKTDTLVSSKWNEKKPIKQYNEYSNESPNDSRKHPSFYDSKILDFKDNGVTLLNSFANTNLNIGAISFTSDGKKAYYTRNQKKSRGVYQLEIWEASLIAGKWNNHKKLYFNNPNHSYFHPAITPDGKRLYYVSDDPTMSKGGTDIYFVDKNEDGSWKSTTNAGSDINTEGNELFPTFYEGSLFFSSNGHPGLGSLDIFRVINEKGIVAIKNLGYPINSSKDDFGFSINGNNGFFSTNRYGSDDVLTFNYEKAYVKLKGNVVVDGNCIPGKKVYITQNTDGVKKIIDSSIIDQNCGYVFKVRPNQEYTLEAYDSLGNQFAQNIVSDGYELNNKEYAKQVALINIPLPQKEIEARMAALAAEEATMNKSFKRTIDSLKTLTNDYVELHHPFDQVYIIDRDLNSYYKTIERVKRIKHKEIVIVSAADCNGSLEYNENLSLKRAQRIYKTLSKLSDNKVIIKEVGERELLKACGDLEKDIEAQVVNRYSYVFIIDKK